jgi:hypothetical protein
MTRSDARQIASPPYEGSPALAGTFAGVSLLRQQARSRIMLRLALAVLALLALGARLLPGERTIDDAYITFRYARNLLAGHGFVYNPGERVLGTTTPLYTALMAGEKLALPAVDFPALACWTNALADAGTAIVLALLCARLLGVPWMGLACAALWAVHPTSVTFAISGMETSVYVLLLVLTLYAYAAGHDVASAVLCGFATLTRPDALLLAAPLFAHMLWQRRRIPWRAGLAFALVVAPWAAFATVYFGSPLPHSVPAKAAAYRIPPLNALVQLIQHYGTPFLGDKILGPPWIGIGAILYLALSLLGGLALVRREQRLMPLVLYPWLYFAVFAARNPPMFRWYLVPMLPMYIVCILYGIRKLGVDLGEALRPHWPGVSGAAWAVGSVFWLAAATSLLLAWEVHPDHGPDRPAPEAAWFQMEHVYRRATLDLMAHRAIGPGTVIAVGDIGIVGYISDAQILDTLGLVSPQSTVYYPLPEEAHVIVYAVPTQLILDQQPDYVMLFEVYGRNTLLRSPEFAADYELYRSWPTDTYIPGSNAMLIFQRRGVTSG